MRGSKFIPGDITAFSTSKGKASGIWGFGNGLQYNARLESLNTTWKRYQFNRGIVKSDSFWESGKEIVSKDGKLFNIGVIYNDNSEFCIITTPANSVVKLLHGRMPLIMSDQAAEDFLNNKEPVLLEPEYFKIA